ncbi:polysaccharide lyase 8 family protein [Streptomyces sp. VRA16 Mangrove soil]|uniref:polysaccharide lyase 8 family protein n=1 Tax=Streptomyces sp. VRA16 Mangrove soil TaxID=2817434 RepID=UPI001A9D075B|nr:polysaccharide lyase 8 family protein [Streptomyces sp. VRA16 Mangrove soil]MBO1329730.1 polysaccharide lyase 8 family protein [Streptomyces sp. VRA16 Mangrove soil]
MQWSRRQALALAGAGAAATVLPLAGSAAAADDPYATLLARAEEQLTGGAFDADDADFAAALTALDTQAAAWWRSVDTSAGRTALWADLAPASDPAKFGQSYQRLRTIATAWATRGTSLTGDAAVLAGLLDALRLLHDVGYNTTRAESGNWWYWEIGAPRALMDLCVLLRVHLSETDLASYLATVAKFVPNADRRTNYPTLAETGANRADKAVIVALRGLLSGASDVVALARDGISDVRDAGRNSLFRYVTSGDGFYADGSFVQHDYVAYTGTYGSVLLGSAGQLIALLAGSAWAVTDAGVTVLYEAVERTFSPVLFDGVMMDALRGRAVSRERARDHTDGATAVANILQLAAGAPQAYADRWRAAAKGWILRNRETPYATLVGIPALATAKAVVADPAIRPAARLTGHHVFADMDRVVHRRPAWALALSLSSQRIAAYEAGNGENLHGWYTGDGMTYVYDGDDLDAFGDGFWPTVDPYRLPGTTVDTRARVDLGTAGGTSTYRPKNAVAGGAALGGRYGAAAMELTAEGSTLHAKKAWFCLDNAVVALGCDIRAGDGRTIETVVENRNLHAGGAPALTVDGHRQPADQGWSAELTDARWAHLDGTGGYVFPSGGPLRALREERTGSWRDVNTGADTAGTTTPVTRRYATLWFDHGVSPTAASYAYVLLPGASATTTASWSRSRPVRVLANSPTVQAVACSRLGLLAAHFWAAGDVDGLSADGPGTVLVVRRDGGVSVAVADPGRTATTLTVRLPFPVRAVVRADDTVQVRPGRRPVLTVQVGGSRGHTHSAELA